MAYRIICDNNACGNEIDSGENGTPAGTAKRRVYCARCAAYLEGVEEELRKEESRLAREAAEWIDERRSKLLSKLIPENKLGAASHSPPEAIPANPPRGMTAPAQWPIAEIK